MIRLNVLKIRKEIERMIGKKLTMKDVSEGSGVDPSTLSRLTNHPEIAPSTIVIDKLVQFFFLTILGNIQEKNGGSLEFMSGLERRQILEEVIRKLVLVYPDREDFWAILPQQFQENKDTLELDTLWSVYESLLNKKHDSASQEKSNLKMALLKKLESARDGLTKDDVKLKFSADEFKVLLDMLPLPPPSSTPKAGTSRSKRKS